MTMHIVLGRAGAGKTARCLDEIRARLREGAEGTPLVLILPEHATFLLEKQLADTPGIGGFTRAYVFGFRRLAHRILMETGGALRPRVTELGKRLLLSKVLYARLAEFKSLTRAARQRNFTEPLAAMVEEFKSYGIGAERLQEVAAALDDSSLKDKIADLALIYQGFTDEMRGRYVDGEDCLDLAAERLAGSEMMRDAEVWIDGFVFFNPQEMAIVREILRVAKSVTVTLCLAQPERLAHQSETSPFHRQWKTRQKLIEMAETLSIPVAEYECDGQPKFARAAGLSALERNLYRFPARRGADSAGIRIAEAANRRLEVEGVACDMIRLCREQGYRWREIGVLIRDRDNYEQVLTAVLADYGIPFFSDSKRRSVHHPLAELLRSSLEAIGGWKYDPLFRCFKTDFFDASRAQIDQLENYVLAFGIRGNRWKMPEDWTYRKRLSLDEDDEPDEAQLQDLAAINATRRQAIVPLLEFESRMKAARDVRAMVEALYGLLVLLRVPEKLERWALEAEARGALDEAREHRQLWEAIIELFEQIVETSGEDTLALADFEVMVGEGLEGLALSLIPQGLDYVTVASFDQNSMDNVRAVYIIGVNEGAIPRRVRPEGLLTDAERGRMAECGVELAAGAGGNNFAERFLVYSALTRASDYLWVSYPLADSEGGGLAPSPLIARIREIVGMDELWALPLKPVSEEEGHAIAQPRQAVAKLAGAVRDWRKGAVLSPIWREVYNWALERPDLAALLRTVLGGIFYSPAVDPLSPELAGALYAKNRRLRGSVTRFERFRACPFHHFAAYGLRLKERSEFRFEAPDLGQFLHAALKQFGERMKEMGRTWGDVGEVEHRDICGQIVAGLSPKLQNEILLSSAQHRHLLGRIRRTVERSVWRLIAFDRVSAFHPVALEQSFGRGKDALPPLTYMLANGYQLEISGQIDRIDCFDEGEKRHFLILDYKSGNAYLNMIDVYYGLKLQLLTYLLVAQNSARQLLGKEALPAGILYYFLKDPVLSQKHRISEKETLDKLDALLKMPGWVLADIEMIRRIDSSFKFIKVSVTANGSIHMAARNSVKTEDEFSSMLQYVDGILADTGRRILGGDISVSPFELEGKRACTYCAYSAFCRFDKLLPGCAYRRLDRLQSDAVMRAIEENKEYYIHLEG